MLIATKFGGSILKKIILIILITTSLLSCATTKEPTKISANESNESIEAPKVLDAQMPIGSRHNPVPIGAAYNLEVNNSAESALLTVSVVGVTRGPVALSFIKERNPFNPEPEPGMEYILPMIMVANQKDLTEKGIPYTVNEYMFKVADSGYSYKKQFNPVVIGEPYILDSKLYEGSYTAGVAPYVIPIGSEAYLIISDVWFWLGTKNNLPE